MADKRGRLKMGTDNFYPAPFWPIGSIYISVNNTNPSNYFGGTWEQITDDAYLKIVSRNAGSLNGTSSQHKIPIESMPSHQHNRIYAGGNSDWPLTNAFGLGEVASTNYATVTNPNGAETFLANRSVYETSHTGGSQAYYPYYLGVYVFKRTA